MQRKFYRSIVIRGPKKYEFWQLIAMFLYGIVFRLGFRGYRREVQD